jgi:hypothetical protein
MKRLAMVLSLIALSIAVWRVFALSQEGSHIFQPSWLLGFFLPCGSALLAFITPEKPWVAWGAWVINLLLGGTFLVVSVIYWQSLLFGPYAPAPLSLVQIAILFIIAPLVNVAALRPWSGAIAG